MRILHPVSTLAIALGAATGLALSVDHAPEAAAAAPAEFQVDPSHSFLIFSTRHLGIGQAYGRFDGFSGAVEFDPEHVSQSSIQLVVEAESVDSGNQKRDQHLRSPDFFSVKEYPEITFESTGITGTKDALEVTGELTLLGKTREVRAEGKLLGEGEAMGGYRAGFLATFSIDMKDFGIAFVSQNPGALGPEVELTVSLECIRE